VLISHRYREISEEQALKAQREVALREAKEREERRLIEVRMYSLSLLC
jgi:hypothetical protein